MPEPIDIKEFARRVERVCDFFLDKSEKDGSADIRIIEDLKDDAADIHMGKRDVAETLAGLANYMKGVSAP